MYPAYWAETITIYHCTLNNGRAAWASQVLRDCFLQIRPARQQVNNAWRDGVTAICRIPAPVPDVALGDVVVRGVCSFEVDESQQGKRINDLLNDYRGDCFRVAEIHDNSRAHIPVPHLYLGGG